MSEELKNILEKINELSMHVELCTEEPFINWDLVDELEQEIERLQAIAAHMS